MATLLLRLAGPMQAWGTTSRFDERDSGMEPSKSGVIGLICAALGRDRGLPVDDLAALRMAVRVDREGLLMRDYQTATGVLLATGKPDHKRTVVSPRFYLSDAVFLVGLEGDASLLNTIHTALQRPVWPLSLGRKAMPPALPVWLPEGVQQADLLTVMGSWPRLTGGQAELAGQADHALRLMLEHPSEGAVRLDQPVGPFAQRRFGPRFVKPEVIHVSDQTQA
ncbi:type I-E CRISPR-associated protein Cas5/CasD [uncultured Herbaspirillum sp.]|uniref:type I-E CRISPR-associated protein Cas5/CasD n=1 Tax=uncultured Herbaspirillum sp. TaxID=160236 RepID=UPI00258AD14B|nr:type I-E CRISPR-associated protein Cas5/CasD [uncultured Herbaspirillum sp.]